MSGGRVGFCPYLVRLSLKRLDPKSHRSIFYGSRVTAVLKAVTLAQVDPPLCPYKVGSTVLQSAEIL